MFIAGFLVLYVFSLKQLSRAYTRNDVYIDTGLLNAIVKLVSVISFDSLGDDDTFSLTYLLGRFSTIDAMTRDVFQARKEKSEQVMHFVDSLRFFANKEIFVGTSDAESEERERVCENLDLIREKLKFVSL